MATKKQNTLRGIGRQIESMMRVRLAKTQEQDQRTWAKVVKSHETLPEIYQHFFQSHISKGDAFPYTVLTSTYERSGSTITGKLMCIIDQVLFVLEETAGKLTDIRYPMNQINYVEVSSKLLEFCVTINGVTDLGIQTSSVFRCSTVTDHLFAPILERIRLQDISTSELVPDSDIDAFDHWSEQNFKFMNLARHCLLPKETVIVAILQSELYNGAFSFPDRLFPKVMSPTHTCILTDRELILIHEDLLQRRKDKYGSISTYIPLAKVLSVSMSSKPGNLLAVSIQLIDHTCFECLFDASLEHEVEKLVARAREQISIYNTLISS